MDPPGGLDQYVRVIGEHGGEPLLLAVGEQACPGAQDPPDAVGRVPGPAVVPARLLLQALPAAVQRVPGKRDDVKKGSVTATAWGRASVAAEV